MEAIHILRSYLQNGVGATIVRFTVCLWFLGTSTLLGITLGCNNSNGSGLTEETSGFGGANSNAQGIESRGGSGASGGLVVSGSGGTEVKVVAGSGNAGRSGNGGNGGSSGKGGSSPTTPDASVDAGVQPHLDGSVDAGIDAHHQMQEDASIDAGDAGSKDASLQDSATRPCAECCADGFTRGTASTSTTPRLVAKFDPSPEGVAVCPNGDLFVALSNNGEIRRVPLDGTASELWTTLTGRQLAGLTCDHQGRLFAAQYGGTPTPPQVVMITSKGDPGTPLPSPASGPAFQNLNGIFAIRDLGVYASDSTGNLIARFNETSEGVFEAKIAATDVAGANGMAYDPKAKKLYVGLSLNNKAVSLDVAQDGSLGAPKDVWTGGDLLGWVDGVAVDEQGRAYVAYYLAAPGIVVRISDNKTVASISDVSPASLAFRGGTLYFTDYKVIGPTEGGLYAIDLGVCGMLAR